MKSTKRLMPVAVTAVLSMLLFVSGTFAQNRNDLLIMQSLDKPNETALTQLSIGMHNDWREAGVRKMRIQMDGDQPGTYNKIVDFDAKGNVARKEVADGETYAYDYDKQDRIKRVTTYKDGAEASAQYFYYDRKGDLRKSVLKTGEKNKEIVGLYNKYNHLDRVQYYTKGMMTKSLVIKYVYNDAGLVTSMRTPDLKASYLYADGQLAQFREEAVGKTKQINVKWGENGLAGLKKYEEKDGDMILMETVAFEYNTAGLVARKTVKPRDPNAETKIKNVFYDAFGEGAMAVRADWDGGGYGYGTPVIIKWSNPDLDTRVTDKNVPIKFSLKPGVGQEMPDIKAMTLRLNHKDTKKEIGNVVLKKKGDGNDFYIEEDLDLFEGENTVFLEVETELGKFTSGERFITYKNPKRQIKVADLHVLAIGISDYGQDHLDLSHTNNDVKALTDALATQQGKLFGAVKTKVLTDGDATKANITEAIQQIKGKAAAEDLVLVYFAGHGEEYEGNFYLKPSDVKENRSDLAASAIDNRWVIEEISRYNAPALFFMDASHAVESPTGDMGSANLDEVKEDFENVIDSDDEIRIFMSSTSSKQKSKLATEGGTSYFTKALLEGIEGKADVKGNNNGYVTVNELSEYVADRVLDMTSWKQKPSHVKRGIGLVPVAKVSE